MTLDWSVMMVHFPYFSDCLRNGRKNPFWPVPSGVKLEGVLTLGVFSPHLNPVSERKIFSLSLLLHEDALPKVDMDFSGVTKPEDKPRGGYRQMEKAWVLDDFIKQLN